MTFIPRSWGVAATLAWIAVQNVTLCEELEDVSKAKCNDLAIRLGIFVAERGITDYPTVPEAKRVLLKALISCEVKAWAYINWEGDRVLIGPGDWSDLEFRDDEDKKTGIIAERVSHGARFVLSHIRFALDDIRRRSWPADLGMKSASPIFIADEAQSSNRERRGRKPTRFENNLERIKNDIQNGTITEVEICKMDEYIFVHKYNLTRYMASKLQKYFRDLGNGKKDI
jgi:hypothetical protein